MRFDASRRRLGPEEVALGVAAFERGERTERCVESVVRTAPGLGAIIVVDDGSQSASVESVLSGLEARFGAHVVRSTENRGPAAAKNLILDALPRGIRAVAFLDNDVIALEGWLEAGLRSVAEGVDLLQPLLITGDKLRVDRGPNRGREQSLSAHPDYMAMGAPLDHPDARTPRANHVVGGTLIAAMEVFEAIGGFDPRFRVGEDYEFSFRAKEAGFALGFSPDCRLIHDHQFDLSYDLVRSSPADCLRSHWLMLELHGRSLYSPRHFSWYRWLLDNGEPMYLSGEERRASTLRRFRRRASKELCMRLRRSEWGGLDEARSAARALAESQGWTQSRDDWQGTYRAKPRASLP